jgi:hypothetical protein
MITPDGEDALLLPALLVAKTVKV